MKITIKARLGAREERVEKIDETYLVVAVKELPIKGKANQAIVAALARYFGVRRVDVRIVVGRASRNKIVEIVGYKRKQTSRRLKRY